jgi:F0F1-type ATP synthase assembly protein I
MTREPDRLKEADSVTARKGFAVAASPLNEVKLDLGVILVVGLVLFLVQERALDSLPLQLLLLLSYGVLGMIWIIVRARRVVAKMTQEREQSPNASQ